MPTDTVHRTTAGLGTVISTELYRAIRSSTPWLMLLAPAILALPMLVATALNDSWQAFRGMTLTGWGSLLPALTALTVGLAVRQDRDAWLFLLASPVPRERLVLGKAATLVIATAAAHLVLALALWIGALNSGIAVPVDALLAALTMWIALIGVTGLMLLITLVAGVATTVATGLVGALAGMLTADGAFWFVNPFGWPLRAMLPFGQVQASGVPLPEGSPLADTGPVIAAMLLSLALAAVTTALSCTVLRHKEI